MHVCGQHFSRSVLDRIQRIFLFYKSGFRF
jgi:hypothetical protein